mmetsp:Transcript_5813/g.19827  ORF Transcript_5813/g.19827 Transcript_5813/m.19827 type:complete len:337 (+) Transcript_5813:1663-2673(+)
MLRRLLADQVPRPRREDVRAVRPVGERQRVAVEVEVLDAAGALAREPRLALGELHLLEALERVEGLVRVVVDDGAVEAQEGPEAAELGHVGPRVVAHVPLADGVAPVGRGQPLRDELEVEVEAPVRLRGDHLVVHARRRGVHAAQERRAARRAVGLRVVAGEFDAAGGQRVEEGRLHLVRLRGVRVVADVVEARVVGEEEEEVRRVRGGVVAFPRRGARRRNGAAAAARRCHRDGAVVGRRRRVVVVAARRRFSVEGPRPDGVVVAVVAAPSRRAARRRAGRVLPGAHRAVVLRPAQVGVVDRRRSRERVLRRRQAADRAPELGVEAVEVVGPLRR